jgi:membrane fusion protein (multidrug efflux system)
MPSTVANGKKKVIGLLLLAMVAGVVVAVFFYMHYQTYHVTTDDAFVDGNIYTITSLIPGKVVSVLVDDNQPVKKDQVLVQIDTTDLQANLHTATQNLAVVKNQIAGQYASITVEGAQRRELEAQLELVAIEKERLTKLLAEGAVAQSDFDKNRAQWKTLKAEISAANKQEAQTKSSIGPKDIEGKVAAIRLAEAAIAQIQLQIDHAAIRAPIDGLITRKSVTVGEVVATGQPLMAVVPLQEIFVTANYKETQLTLVRPGQAVDIDVDTYPGVNFKGKVASIMAGTGSVFSLLPPQNATGNYIKVVQRIPVKIELIGADLAKYPLRFGMSVVPTILVKGP